MESETQNKIIIKDLIKIYKRGPIDVPALRGLSCEFQQGEITVIMGPSGCGKTTLLNILGGISRPSSGSILIEENDICQYTDKQLELLRRDVIAYVYQENNLLPILSAYENIILPLQIQKKEILQEKSRIEKIIDFIGIKDRLDHFPFELSGGEQQRVAIASALSKNAKVILCDEPTGELDSKSKSKILSLLKQIRENNPTTTIIVVTHDHDFKLIADKVYFIKDGRISYKMDGSELTAFQQENYHDICTSFGDSPNPPTERGDLSKNIQKNDGTIIELEELKYMIEEKLKKIKKSK